MTSLHPNLFTPTQIGNVGLKNRIVMPAMDQNLCDGDGQLTEANIVHYERRAAGGAAAVIVETSAVAYPGGAASRHQPSLATDECIEPLRRLATRVHAHGTRVFVQICHHGKTSLVDTVEGRPQLVPSTPLPPMDMAGFIKDMTIDELMRMAERMQGTSATYHQATTDELAAVVDAFASAARRVQRAGCDGVEIHAAHGYLLSSFLSPHWNRREDEYGSNVKGRTRLLQEVIGAIKNECGSEFAVIVRLDGQEFNIEGGITLDLAARHASAAAQAGADAIHVSAIGSPDSGVSFTEGPLPWLPGQYRELTKTIRAAVDLPVIGVGRIDPAIGDAMIAAGEVDCIAMGRQLLADPDTPQRLRSGRPDLVRPCINCFVCVAENFWDATPRCAVNARLGRPDAPEILRASEQRSIGIVGGGPAGLETARVAAQRGHKVTLYESAAALGGTARFSGVTTPINATLVEYLVAAVKDAGVDVRLSTTATAAMLAAARHDRVVLATGASRSLPELAGANLSHVLTGDDLRDLLVGHGRSGVNKLSSWQRPLVRGAQLVGLTTPSRVRTLSKLFMPLGRRIVVLGGGLVGVEIAEFLAERGRVVTVIEPSPYPGVEMAHPRRWRTMHRARSHGVVFETNAAARRITSNNVEWTRDGDITNTPADHVIVASEVHTGAPLEENLRARGIAVDVIGDAAAVGYIEGAIRMGHDLGATV